MIIQIIKWLIKALFWLQAFAAPVIFLGIIALWIASRGEKYASLAIMVSAVGIVSGFILAEYIRRKIGLENFFARVYGSHEPTKKMKK